MKTLALCLRLVAPVFFIVGALHLVLGLQAEVLLGAQLTPATIADPALDSQNRFYGVAFTLYGVLLLVCASDLRRHALVLRCLLWVMFAAGAARLASMAVVGSPPPLIWLLMASELLPPPLIAWWLSRVLSEPS